MKADLNGAFSFFVFTCCTSVVADITVLVDELLRKLCSGMVICNVCATVMKACVLVRCLE